MVQGRVDKEVVFYQYILYMEVEISHLTYAYMLLMHVNVIVILYMCYEYKMK